MSRPIRFLVLDDHPMVGIGIAEALRAFDDLECVGTTGEPEAAERFIAQGCVDVLLLDVRLGALDGIAVCSDLRARYPETEVLIISSFADAQVLRRALAAGAKGLALKSIALDMMPAAVRQVHRGEIFVASELILSTLAEDDAPGIDIGQTMAQPLATRPAAKLHILDQTDQSPARLTPREGQIVALVTRGLGNKEIARELAISPDTVKLHISRMLKRFGFRSRVQLAALCEPQMVTPDRN